MTELKQVYKCSICGNIVEVLHTGAGELVCCGQPMDLEEAKTEDEGQEKHVPVIEKTEKGIKVKIGSVAHPMEDAHFIEWIELVCGDNIRRKVLKSGDAPEAEFCVCNPTEYFVRAYCNVHGLWKSK